MPKVTEAHLEARREQILSAASSCFARKGFHGCTMQDICTEAELSPGAIYRYFRSKEEIIEAMCEEYRRQNLELIEVIRQADDTAQVLEDLAQAFFPGLEEPETCALDIELWAEALRNPDVRSVFCRSFDVHLEAFTEIIRRAQQRGEVSAELEPTAVARVMMSLFQGLLLQKALAPETDISSYVAVVRAMMTGGFWVGARPAPAITVPTGNGGGKR